MNGEYQIPVTDPRFPRRVGGGATPKNWAQRGRPQGALDFALTYVVLNVGIEHLRKSATHCQNIQFLLLKINEEI